MADVKAIYDIAFRCIDYCKDIQNGGGSYNEYFSPNNIRRLIISPDVVAVEFFISVPNQGSGYSVRIPTAQLLQLSCQPGYVPIVGILATDRVCSSVEEVVFLMMDNSRTCCLSEAEYQFQVLAGKGYANRDMESVITAIKKRFVRLRALTRLACSWNEFKTVKRDRGDLVATNPVFKNVCQYTPIHNEADWYTRWGNAAAAQYYPTMDGVNGHLWRFFKDDIEKRRKLDKADEVEEFTRKKVTAATAEFDKQYKGFLKITRIHNKLRRILDNTQPIDGVEYQMPHIELSKFYDCDVSMVKAHVQQPPEGMSTKDIIKENKERVQKNVQALGKFFTDLYFNTLRSFADKYPYCTKVMLKDAETSIIPNSDDLEWMATLAQKYHYTCDGKNILTSSVNVCWQFMLFFVKRDENFLHDYVRPEYWKEAR